MHKRPSPQLSRNSQSGQALVEFVLTLPILLILAFGTFSVSQLLERYLTVLQITRNAGNMYSRSVDFSLIQNKQLLLEASNGLSMTLNGGAAVVYLSTVEVIDTGANSGEEVVTHRITIGNTAVAASQVAVPGTVLASGEVVNFENDPLAVASISNALTLEVGELVYVVESYHQPTDIDLAERMFGQRQLSARSYY